MVVTKRDKIRLDGLLKNEWPGGMKVYYRKGAVSAEQAMLRWERTRELPYTCSNPELLRQFIVGAFIGGHI